MSFFLHALYTIFLGVVAENLLVARVQCNAGGVQTTIVDCHVNKSNVARLTWLLILFFADWIIFAILFKTDRPTFFGGADIALIILNVPTLISLYVAVMLSLENTHRLLLPVAVHQFLGFAAEILWCAFAWSQIPSITGEQLSTIVIIGGFYGLCRLGICILCIIQFMRKSVTASIQVIGFSALLLRIAVYVALAKLGPDLVTALIQK